MKIAAIIQARMSSDRFPGKVLEPILGQPMLCRQLERVRNVTTVDTIIVATSHEVEDDPIASTAAELGVVCYRGSLTDVLDRFQQAATSCSAEHVVRLTGDCPLTDPELVDQIIERHLAERNDYTSNIMELSFPDGLDAEVISVATLQRAWQDARLPEEREHVTPYIYRNSDKFKIGSVTCEQDLSELRWTVDYPADLELIRQIFAALYPHNPKFSFSDVLELISQQPRLQRINAGFKRSKLFVDGTDHEVLPAQGQ